MKVDKHLQSMRYCVPVWAQAWALLIWAQILDRAFKLESVLILPLEETCASAVAGFCCFGTWSSWTPKNQGFAEKEDSTKFQQSLFSFFKMNMFLLNKQDSNFNLYDSKRWLLGKTKNSCLFRIILGLILLALNLQEFLSWCWSTFHSF